MTLNEWRALKGLTMQKAGAVLGISQPTISRLESGKQKPDWRTLGLLMERTDGAVTPNDFISANQPWRESLVTSVAVNG